MQRKLYKKEMGLIVEFVSKFLVDSLILFVFVSQLYIAVTKCLIMNNLKEKIFVLAWFRSFQSKAIWLHHRGFEPCQGGELFTIRNPWKKKKQERGVAGSREEEERKERARQKTRSSKKHPVAFLLRLIIPLSCALISGFHLSRISSFVRTRSHLSSAST